MDERRIHVRPWHLASTGGSSQGRRRSGLAAAISLACLIPAFALLAPASTWGPPQTFLTLAAIALISYFGATAIRSAKALDAAFIAALVALVVLGPLPAAVIWIATEVGAFLFQRRRIEAFLANAASFGWATLAAALLLSASTGDLPAGGAPAAQDYPVIVAAGFVMLMINFFVAAVIIDVVRDGNRLLPLARRELIGPLPVTFSMLLVGAVTIFLQVELGMLALGLFACAVLIPEAVLPIVFKPHPVSDLDHADAVSLYAQAMSEVLGLGRSFRLVVKDAATYMREPQLRSREGKLSDLSDRHRIAVVEAVLYHGEHWDCHGGTPGAVGGEMIPLASRILAVADAWSGLTAKGSPRLNHAQALNQIRSRAGMHFDPAMVQAARKVVAQERFGVAPEAVAYQPRLHRLPLPQLTRRLAALAS
jgi:hypothetical protein